MPWAAIVMLVNFARPVRAVLGGRDLWSQVNDMKCCGLGDLAVSVG